MFHVLLCIALCPLCNHLRMLDACLSSWCLVIVIVRWLFLAVPWVGLQCVIVVFPDHTHLLFFSIFTD